MIYIGNFKDWINDSVINIILSTAGDRRPDSNSHNETRDLESMWKTANYTSNKIGWEMYYESHVGKLIPPIDVGTTYEHWFCKMNPGDMLPLHDDRYEGKPLIQLEQEGIKVNRYWMACQDMIPGHVFAYKNTLLDNYRAGDLFLFPEAGGLHASCNIGLVPKISYQLTQIVV